MKARADKAKGQKVTVKDLKPKKAGEVKGGVRKGGDCAVTSDTGIGGCPG